MVNIDYKTWPLSRQLKLTQIIFSLLIALSLILITRYQLLSIEDQFISNYESLLNTEIHQQMQELTQNQKSNIELEFTNFIDFVSKLQKLDSLILGYSNTSTPIKANPPVQTQSYNLVVVDYTTGAFFSRNSLSQAGMDLEKRQAGMDKIYPLIAQPQYLNIYSGFEVDEIIHYYPASYMNSTKYSPLTREWYYRAKDQPGTVMITEPYVDAITKKIVLTLSKAIFDNNQKFYGVAACDITLNHMQSMISSTTILQNGFLMLISIGGMILTLPTQWNITQGSTIIIYDTDNTGISKTLWTSIISSEDGSVFDFSRKSVNYYLIKYEIKTVEGLTTHYVVACADVDEILEPADEIRGILYNGNYLVFFLVVGIEIVLFLGISFLLHFVSSRLSFKLKCIKNVFARISHRTLIPDVTKGALFNEIVKNKEGIESIVEGTKLKIFQVREKEESFNYYPWSSTRPDDCFWYSKWCNKLYPFNYFSGKIMDWRKSVMKIQTEIQN